MSIQFTEITRVDPRGSSLPELKIGVKSEEACQIIFRLYDKNVKKIATFTSQSFTGIGHFKVTCTGYTVSAIASAKIGDKEISAGTYTLTDSCCCWK